MKLHAHATTKGIYRLRRFHQPWQIVRAGHYGRVEQWAEQVSVFLGLSHEQIIKSQRALWKTEARYQLVARQHKLKFAPGIGRQIDVAHARSDRPILALLSHEAGHGPHDLISLDRMSSAEVLHVHPCAGELEDGVQKLKVLPTWPELKQVSPDILAHTHMLTHLQDGRPVLACRVEE